MNTGVTRIPVLLLLLLFCCEAFSQTNPPQALSCRVTIDLLNVSPEKDRVKVTLITPPVQSGVIYFVLPKYLPGVPGSVDAGRFVHQFYALDDKGFPLKVKKKNDNVIVMRMQKGATLRKIEYWVDDTWDDEKKKARTSDEKFNYVPQVAGSNIEAGTSYLINHAFYVGYIQGYENIPYTVTVVKPEQMAASTALHVTELGRSRDEYTAKSYAELVDNPVMYCVPDTLSLQSDNLTIGISVFSENGKITARQVRKLVAAQLAASANFLSSEEPRRYQLIFYFTTPFRTVLNIHGGYDGLAHRGSAFYFLPELADEDALESELLRETSGDILHLVAPLDFRASCGNPDFLHPQVSENWWVCKGANLYFGWLAAVRDSFASENEFMGVVSANIRLAEQAPHKSLTDMSSLQEMVRKPLSREVIFARAMLTSLLLDIRITELTGGKGGLREALFAYADKNYRNSDSLEAFLVRFAGPSIHEFFENYVRGTRPLPYIESLSHIGWAYAPEAIDSVFTFGHFGLTYDGERDAFFVHNADTNNLFGLQNGDRIISVDNILVNAISFDEALDQVYRPRTDEPVEIRYLHNEENVVKMVRPVSVAIIVQHLIRKDPVADKKMQEIHRAIFSPQLSPGS